MPDLQTALSSVAKQINFDDGPHFDDDLEVTTHPEPKNFAQRLFYWFVANPASTAREAKNALGVTTDGPVSGRIHQMHARGLLTRVDGIGGFRYTATCTEYPEFTTAQRRELMAKAIAIRKAKPKKVKAAKKVAEVKFIPPKTVSSLNANPNAEQIVNSMSVGLAKAVYLELKKVFEA
jgi:hypothetical protein